MRVFPLAATLAVTASACLIGAATAESIPFSDVDWTINHSTVEDDAATDPAQPKPSITGGVLYITEETATSEANSAYYLTPVAVDEPFVATFSYTQSNFGGQFGAAGGADGATFFFTDLSTGTTAIGGRGSGIGWGANDSGGQRPGANFIPNSVAVEFTGNSFVAGDLSTGIVTAGAGGANAGDYQSTGFAYTDGAPLDVTVSYDGADLTVSIVSPTVSMTPFVYSEPVDIASIVGGSTAYLGFTGGSGGVTGEQAFSDLTFTTVPEPAAAALVCLGVAGAAARRRVR